MRGVRTSRAERGGDDALLGLGLAGGLSGLARTAAQARLLRRQEDPLRTSGWSPRPKLRHSGPGHEHLHVSTVFRLRSKVDRDLVAPLS